MSLNGPAPAGGSAVALSSSNVSAATVPSSVVVPAGLQTATFSISTNAVTADSTATITASYAGVTRTSSLSVLAPVLSALSLNPTSVMGRQTSTGTATLTGQAPAGGAIVSLATSNPSAATVPGSTTVPQGASSANFVETAGPVQAPATAVISGTFSATRSATLTVTPCTVSTAPAPVLPAGDTIWVEDAVPPGSIFAGITNRDNRRRTTLRVPPCAVSTVPPREGFPAGESANFDDRSVNGRHVPPCSAAWTGLPGSPRRLATEVRSMAIAPDHLRRGVADGAR